MVNLGASVVGRGDNPAVIQPWGRGCQRASKPGAPHLGFKSIPLDFETRFARVRQLSPGKRFGTLTNNIPSSGTGNGTGAQPGQAYGAGISGSGRKDPFVTFRNQDNWC